MEPMSEAEEKSADGTEAVPPGVETGVFYGNWRSGLCPDRIHLFFGKFYLAPPGS